jgi:hypothetical protein
MSLKTWGGCGRLDKGLQVTASVGSGLQQPTGENPHHVEYAARG